MVKIGKAAEILGTTPETLRLWETTGELLPTRKTLGGTRYYSVPDLLNHQPSGELPTLAFARVSADHLKDDLDRQQAALEAYCASRGWRTIIIRSICSSVSSRSKSFRDLLEMLANKRVRRLVLTHVDRLLLAGNEVIFTLCQIQGIEIVIINQRDQRPLDEGLAQEVSEILHAQGMRLNKIRTRIHKSLPDNI